MLKDIRKILIEAGQAKGCGGPWLSDWWLFMNQAREAIEGIEW